MLYTCELRYILLQIPYVSTYHDSASWVHVVRLNAIFGVLIYIVPKKKVSQHVFAISSIKLGQF